MRHIAVAALLLVSAAPALAAPQDREDAELARIAHTLNDPRMQSAASGIVIAMADMIMDLRVDKFRAAIARIDPDARNDRARDDARTLGDVIERDDPYVRDKIARDSRTAVGSMGAMAGSMAELMPELRQMGERMGKQMEKAMRNLPRD